MTYKADLHCHSTFSDGSASIDELIQSASDKKLDCLSITDHDFVMPAGTFLDAVSYANVGQVCLIPGLEISAWDSLRKRKVHLLAYGFDLKAANIKAICDPILHRRNQRSEEQIALLGSLGFAINREEVMAIAPNAAVLYKQHIMALLIKKGLAEDLYGELYQRLFKNQGPLAGDIEYVDIFLSLEAVKADGGLAVIAHPGLLDTWDLVPELINAGLDGIEVFHPSHSLEHIQRAQSMADTFKLYVSGGSDFHGSYGDEPEIGSFSADSEFVNFLLNRNRC